MPKSQKPLRQLATEKLHGKGSNPSQLGDPISLKAEAADSEPTEHDRGASNKSTAETMKTAPVPESSGGSHEEKMLKNGRKVRGMKEEDEGDEMQGKVLGEGKEENRTMLGDPTSLKDERREGGGVGHDNGSSGRGRDGSKL